MAEQKQQTIINLSHATCVILSKTANKVRIHFRNKASYDIGGNIEHIDLQYNAAETIYDIIKNSIRGAGKKVVERENVLIMPEHLQDWTVIGHKISLNFINALLLYDCHTHEEAVALASELRNNCHATISCAADLVTGIFEK
jgi:hypothetical protein